MCYVRGPWKRCAALFFVLLTFILEGGVYYCYVAGFWMVADITPGSIILHVLVTFCCFYLVLTQLLCMLINPGNINSGGIEEIDTQGRLNQGEDMVPEDYNAGKVNMCAKCNKLRPARAHHCSLCNTCVYRYDHHCPFVGNCVGLYNYRIFLLYITSVTICAGLIGISCAVYAGQHDDYKDQTLAGAIIGLAACLGVGCFTLFHYGLLSTNRTTIEVRMQSRQVFDVGIGRNWVDICGPMWWCWVCPLPLRPRVDGVRYSVVLRLKDGSVKRMDSKVLV